MKVINFFKTGEEASRSQKFLRDKGIQSRVLVDPLEARYPALSHFGEVGLYVDDDKHDHACTLLKKDYRAA